MLYRKNIILLLFIWSSSVPPIDFPRTGFASEQPEKTGITTIPAAAGSDKAHKAVISSSKKKSIESIKIKGGRFVIQMDYDAETVAFVKTLSRSYWHIEAKAWVCQASLGFIVWQPKICEFWLALFPPRCVKKPRRYLGIAYVFCLASQKNSFAIFSQILSSQTISHNFNAIGCPDLIISWESLMNS